MRRMIRNALFSGALALAGASLAACDRAAGAAPGQQPSTHEAKDPAGSGTKKPKPKKPN